MLGARRRIRTIDLLITNQLLCQLSYAGFRERDWAVFYFAGPQMAVSGKVLSAFGARDRGHFGHGIAPLQFSKLLLSLRGDHIRNIKPV